MAKRSSRSKGLRAKRGARLGQHFLTSKGALAKIVDAADPAGDDIILEIGPGKGILTEALLSFAGKVIAVEKDVGLAEGLREKFAKEISDGRFDLIAGDIRGFDTRTLESYGHPYKVVANIPYYLTGFIIEKFLTASCKPERLVLLVQKEVAERILARDGKESLLSLSVKAYGEPRIVAAVRKGSFSPPPSVDSAILLIERVSRRNFTDAAEESRFFKLLHAGFAHKRKRLAKNLAEAGFPAAAQAAADRRAEDLTLPEWLGLVALG